MLFPEPDDEEVQGYPRPVVLDLFSALALDQAAQLFIPGKFGHGVYHSRGGHWILR